MKDNMPKELRKLLESLPKDAWSIDTGGRHRKIRIGGRMVGILPFGPVTEQGAGHKNLMAQVKRAVATLSI